MSRKHYVAFANVVKQIPDADQRKVAAAAIVAVCKDDNPRFDVQRFLTACDVPSLL